MSKSIREIKAEFEQAGHKELPGLYEEYGTDDRAGVAAIIKKYKRQEDKLSQEMARLEQMRVYEN